MSLCNTCGAVPSKIADITSTDQQIGEIARILVQRTNTAGVANSITVADDDPTLKATWDGLYALTTSERVVGTPILAAGFAIPASEALTYEDAGGVMRFMGDKLIMAEGAFNNKKQSTTIKALKALICEPASADGLSGYLVNTCGNIIVKSTDNGLTIKPVRFRYLYVGSATTGATSDPNKNGLQIQLDGDWSNDLIVITPDDFDALAWKL